MRLKRKLDQGLEFENEKDELEQLRANSIYLQKKQEFEKEKGKKSELGKKQNIDQEQSKDQKLSGDKFLIDKQTLSVFRQGDQKKWAKGYEEHIKEQQNDKDQGLEL